MAARLLAPDESLTIVGTCRLCGARVGDHRNAWKRHELLPTCDHFQTALEALGPGRHSPEQVSEVISTLLAPLRNPDTPAVTTYLP